LNFLNGCFGLTGFGRRRFRLSRLASLDFPLQLAE
jgi:hypothetical protein